MSSSSPSRGRDSEAAAESREVESANDRYAIEHPHGNWHVAKSAAYPVEPTNTTRALVEQKVAHAVEPFIVPDVTPSGVMFTTTFHILRDMVDEGTLVHGGDGYRRPA